MLQYMDSIFVKTLLIIMQQNNKKSSYRITISAVHGHYFCENIII